MSDLPNRASLTELPLILAGPILRRTTPQSVTVWVALQAACRVELRVLATADNGNQIGESLLLGSRETIALGTHLHIIAVTATSEGSVELATDRVYAYDLTFSDGDGQIPDRSLQQAMSAPNIPHERISYFAHGYPTFVLPSSQLCDLRIVHGSCRKPHGEGFDALSILDSLLAESADLPSQRPQQLFLTGDQIYGDDVADPLLWAASHLGETLLGWTERLPVRNGRLRQIEYRLATEFAPGLRAEIATRQAGFTAGLRDRRKKVTSHLFSLGEYLAVYLLACSPACWPQLWPSGRAVTKDRQVAKQWNRDIAHLQKFVEGLGRVRRALANIPMYTIFDDHDVSDDWNLNQAWCLRVLGKPLGKQVVQNALLAYAIFQGWGNTPDRFEAGTSGGKLLAAAQKWSLSRGTDLAAQLEIARWVGMPQSDSRTGLPKFTLDGEVAILDRDPEALVWHYTIGSSCHEVVVLDTRTWRGYHLDRSPIDPPMLLSPTAFERQLIAPLQAKSPTATPVATFIVAPTNLFGLKIIDLIHQWSLERNRVFATDVGDAWNIHTPALAQLITTLFAHRDTVVVLSGDI
ncbi:PhoD-like phosphatase, partial [Chamaesiphon polymorphus]